MTDACTDVKSDIEGGTFTRYTDSIPIYHIGKDDFQGGPVYIRLSNPTRNPKQTVDGGILYELRGCRVEIKAPNATIRENIYDDLCDIFKASNRAYKLKRVDDIHPNKEQDRLQLDVEIIL